MDQLLETENISTGYSNVQVLNEVSLKVEKGEIVALIGSNGTGKSTFLKTIVGWLKPWNGKILFEGKIINNLSSHDIVRLGIAICPEGRRVFPELTVMENLQIGAYIRRDNEKDRDIEKVFSLFPRLAERKSQLGGSLSGGEQQMLALGRALMANPKLLLIDELSLGLAPVTIEGLLKTIQEIKNEGVAILLVEQNAQFALEFANTGYVMEMGKIVLSGSGKELLANESVKKAYLGI